MAVPLTLHEQEWLPVLAPRLPLPVCDGLLTGVIDFGDICAGDPATDLTAAWMLLSITSFARVASPTP